VREHWAGESVSEITIRIVVYLGVSVAAQEFVARGGIQSCLYEFLLGRHRALLAVLGASLIFSVTHVFVSAAFAGMSFLLGCFWGWLYHRHRTLIGAYVSHVLIGIFGLEVMGIGLGQVV
jgi:membrane protease YdiL (CAAX protease family)